ncbi:MAG: chitobiase/beta-hexosaminidase C-terminal domain-containing protein [Bacteroidales bacterium]|nr:chitobiase/beta-hexosaminidase C-terminal domain-containing protein [Bacteroidales bacterium]
MKKYIYHFGIIAALALVSGACNKETEINQSLEGVTHVATVTLGKADVSTRTEVIENETSASYLWLDDDAQYLRVYENGTAGTITDFALNNDRTVATLTVSFTGSPEAPYTYTAKYFSKESTSSHNPLVISEQEPLADNFDPAADVLISKEIVSEKERLSSLSFTMGRIVTVNKMTLTGLEEGEVISSVEFTLDKAITGYASFDADNNSYKYTNGEKKLTLKYNSTNGIVPSDGQFPVYFICAPVDAAGLVSVVVITDKNVYTKSSSLAHNPFDGKDITFAIGTMTRFTMAMSGYGSEIGEEVDYTLVESADKIAAGAQYLIVSTKSGDAGLCAAAAYSSSFYGATDVTSANGIITIGGESVTVFTLEAGETPGQYYIKDSEDSYLNWSSGNSVSRGKKGEGNSYLWTITFDDKKTYITNVGDDTRKLKYNANSPRFACYTSAQTDISLYLNEATIKEDERSTVVLSFNPAEPEDINLGSDFSEPTLTVDPSDASSAVAYSVSSKPEGIATINDNGILTITGAGTITVTAAIPADNETYRPASASYVVNVVDPDANDGSASKPYTASEAAELALGGSTAEVYVKGIISSIETEYSQSYGNISFFISDDGLSTSTEFEIFRGVATSADQFLVGDYVVFLGNLTKFNSTPELAQGGTCSSQVKAPRFVPAGASFTTESQNVTLTADDGATIYYSLDGSDPDTEYTSALSLTATTTVKAKAELRGVFSGVVAKTFEKVSAGVTSPETITFSQQGYENAEEVTDVSGTNCTISFNKGTNNSNAPKYYNAGTAIRAYGGNTFTVSSEKTISKIELSFGSSDGANTITADVDTYSSGTWTGSSSSVTFTIGGTSGQRRISAIKVTYSN